MPCRIFCQSEGSVQVNDHSIGFGEKTMGCEFLNKLSRCSHRAEGMGARRPDPNLEQIKDASHKLHLGNSVRCITNVKRSSDKLLARSTNAVPVLL